jgi:hypothetical protein
MENEMPMQESIDPLAGWSGIVRDAPTPEHSTAALVGIERATPAKPSA